MHIDDDVFGQVTDIVNFLAEQELRKTGNFIGCSKVFHPIVRRDGKWNMPVESYPGNQYPLGNLYKMGLNMTKIRKQFYKIWQKFYVVKINVLGCVGWCFVMPVGVIRDLYWMSLDTPLIFLEDVTTTGILREKV